MDMIGKRTFEKGKWISISDNKKQFDLNQLYLSQDRQEITKY